ncbi:sulfurtransferase complex subunit TusB [Rosenbergiella australiborealis]|uniref:Sulfurtransferase complex subunit TusB n=2 Tax=Rosenbergiella australiborealis TaxID=1544696 RepID=A0ABS5T777_9GAMM|nr:sulfurtransferase complex subunit TusB [Rosenbergiella australiborealis]
MSSPATIDMTYLETFIGERDDVLLLQDAVYGAIKNNHYFFSFLEKKRTGLYLLKEDAQARGITTLIDEMFEMVSYDQFVELTVKQSKQITW